MGRERGGRRGGAVLLLLVLAVVIVSALAFNLAKLEPFQEANADPRQVSSPVPVAVPRAVSSAILLFLGLFLLVGLIVLGLWLRPRTRREAKLGSWWDILAAVLGLAIVVGFLLLWRRFVPGAVAAEDAAANVTGEGLDAPLPLAGGWSIELFFLLAVLASTVAVLWRLRPDLRMIRRRSEEPSGLPDFRRAANVVLGETIRDLELGGNVRVAILACFQRFCSLLRSRGISDQIALTPRELQRLAVRSLAVSQEASATLTALFEEARYSEHVLGDPERRRAIESLGQIQAALGA